MTITCCIHQPEHLPYPGFWAKLLYSNVYVCLDYAQYQKGHFHNRNRIADAKGKVSWLTVPVVTAYGLNTPLNFVSIDDRFMKRKYLNSLMHTYSSAPYFGQVCTIIEQALSRAEKHRSLFDLNYELIESVLSYLNIKPHIVCASMIDIPSGQACKTSRLAAICNAVDASNYVTGTGALAYLQKGVLEKEGINVYTATITSPAYRPNHKPDLSILDLLMHLGSVGTINYLQSNSACNINPQDNPQRQHHATR